MNPSDGRTRLQDWHRPMLTDLTAKATLSSIGPENDYGQLSQFVIR